MTFPKIIFIAALGLFTVIGVVALFKTDSSKPQVIAPVEVRLPPPKIVKEVAVKPQPIAIVETPPPPLPVPAQAPVAISQPSLKDDEELLAIEKINLIPLLFNKGEPRLPIVETIVYKSRVAWMKGRPAWLSDYANHYSTSRHFIARSLNGSPDYFKQDVAEGDRFNVLKLDKEVEFYLVLDATRCKLRLYYFDRGENEKVLLRTYTVGLGRSDPLRTSGSLTPLGKYSLGNKIAIYKPKMMGHHNGQRLEMVKIFGSRWIPFEKEIAGCTAPAKGLGIHGVPWTVSSKGEMGEDTASLGKYESDGCIRLASADMEEIFAIIITKPATIEIVKDFKLATVPGVERRIQYPGS